MSPNVDYTNRLAQLRTRIDEARRRRRAPLDPADPVTLLGVSKRHASNAIAAAHAAGLRDFGENYAQELRDKREAVPNADIHWHFIGKLQRNKVKIVLGARLIHTMDRPALAQAIDARAGQRGVTQDVLVEVNIGREPTKAGVAPEDLPELLGVFAHTPHVRCRGLMAIPPAGQPEETRPYFRNLRELAKRHRAHSLPNVQMDHLSMGMSSDFEVAIEEGATIVRIGTALFGPRPPAA